MATPTRVLTPGQQSKIAELVRLHHYALLVEMLGDKSIPKTILTQIKTRGLYRKPRPDVIKRAFQHGREGLLNSKVLDMDADAFERHLERKGDYLNADERHALDLLKESFTHYMKSLAENFASRVNAVLLKADKMLHRKASKRRPTDLYAETERRKTLATVAKDLAAVTEVQIGNASRVISTETNNAYQEGRAQEILRKSGSDDPLVFKRPRHDACDDCKRAYLEDDGVTPRVFHMSELADNGSNIGKSRAERMPVLDSFHPWCACELAWLPPGFSFNDEGALVYTGRTASA